MRRFIWYEMRFSGRLLNAENVRENSVERLKQVLSPIVALGIPVLGTISDAQKEEVIALSELWPDVPHQTCQFHALREASRPGFEEDGKYLAQMLPILLKARTARFSQSVELTGLMGHVRPEL